MHRSESLKHHLLSHFDWLSMMLNIVTNPDWSLVSLHNASPQASQDSRDSSLPSYPASTSESTVN